MFGKFLPLFTILITTELCVCLKIPKKYEDFFFYSTINGTSVSWMMMPDDNGLVVTAVMEGISPIQNVTANEVFFQLWTRSNGKDPEVRNINEKNNELKFKRLNPSKDVIILIHGFTDSMKDENQFFTILVKAFLDKDDYNVIGINWVKLASIPWYGQAMKNTQFVGALSARAIKSIRSVIGDSREIRIVAHNLGALVAGVAAHHANTVKIDRILGLDPPQLLTKNLPDTEKLDKNDAEVVEIIHTSGDHIGIMDPVGHRDFYPNGGKWPQPGCFYDLTDRCSMRRAFFYLAEALNKNGSFAGVKCDSYKDFRKGSCQDKESVPLWNNLGSSPEGQFYLLTNHKEPFWPPEIHHAIYTKASFKSVYGNRPLDK